MQYLPKLGRLERNLAGTSHSSIPKSETVQSIELTRLPDGSVLEDDEYIRSEKERKLEALKEKYGNIDESQVTWVKIKKEKNAPA